MAHPFEKMFDKALKVSSELDNQVLEEANQLLEKGYAGREIVEVLTKLEQVLIDPKEAEIVSLALAEFGDYLEE